MAFKRLEGKDGDRLRALGWGAALVVALFALEVFVVDPLDDPSLNLVHEVFLWLLMAGVGVCLVLFLLYRSRTKRLARDLAQKELHFRTAFHTSPDAVNINRLSDGLYVDINEGFTNITGYSREDVLGRTSYEIRIWADTADRDRLVAGLKASGVVRNLEATFRRKDGSLTTALMSARVIEIDGVPHILSVTRDISEIKAAREAELKYHMRYRRIFEHIQDVYYEATTAGTIVEVSPSVKAMLGYSSEEVVGTRIESYYVEPAQRERFMAELKATGEVGGFVVVLRHREGRPVHVSVNAVLIPGDEGEAARYCGSFRDVETEFRGRVLLQDSERKYRELVEQANSIIVRLAPDGRVTFVNEFASKFLGISPASLSNLSLFESIFLPDPEEPRFPLSLIEAGIDSRIRTVAALGGEGSEVFVSWSVKVERDDRGEPRSLLCVGNDVTSHVLAERKVALLEAHIAQSQRLEALGTLASGIAHDFNNVLSAIIGYSELVSLTLPEGSKASAHLKSVLDAADRASRLVRQILTFARTERSERRVVALDGLTGEALSFLRASVPSSVEIVTDYSCRGRIEADPTRIHQMVMNLCTNGAKAMPDGGRLTVSLSHRYFAEPPGGLPIIRPGEYFVLSVSDTGVGIEPKIIDRIFDPFFTTRPAEGGTGMGLAVVHGIVADLGGAVRVFSTPGEGSTFEVYLPPAGCEGEYECEPDAGEFGGRERILVVDDEETVAESTRMNLESLGYRVVALTSSAEALAAFERDPEGFDLILSDVTMPVMTGDVLAARVRAISKKVPIILISGFSTRIDGVKLKELGISAFLTKPVNRTALAAELRRALEVGRG